MALDPVKISGLAEATAVVADDMFVIVTDIATTPVTKFVDAQVVMGAWVDWTPAAITGWSTDPTTPVYRYWLVGKKCTIVIRQPTATPSDDTVVSIRLPFNSANVANAAWTGWGRCTDNSAAKAAPCYGNIPSNANVVNVYVDGALTAWTASGNKAIHGLTITYEIA